MGFNLTFKGLKFLIHTIDFAPSDNPPSYAYEYKYIYVYLYQRFVLECLMVKSVGITEK